MRERRCQKVQPPPSPTSTGSSGATLPPDLLKSGARRLGMVAMVAASVTVIFFLFHHLPSSPQPEGRGSAVLALAASLGTIAASLVAFRMSRSRTLGPVEILDRALVYEVAMAFFFSLRDHAVRWPADLPPHGWTGVAVWVLVFPLLVPSTRGKTLLATLASAAMDPLGFLVHVAAGNPQPQLLFMFQLFLPTVIAAIAAVVGARIVFDLSTDVEKAREMGSYRLLSLIGRGGMGEVWRAEHRMLARPAAVKLIRPEAPSGLAPGESQARFEREARATAALTSPHTVQLYDFGTTVDGAFFYAMELLDGFTLDALVRRFGPLPPARAVSLLGQACLSLAEAHAHGLVHRDIKPANIFVCRLGLNVDFVKVLDFGLVKSVTGSGDEPLLTATGFLTGTPSFMPPEVALGKKNVDGRSDLYALGCVGFWLLTGKPVFEGDTAIEVIHDHAKTPPPRPSERTDGPIPRVLEDLIMDCLEKDPNNRPDGALSLERRLAALSLEGAWTAEDARRWWDAVAGAKEDATASPRPAAPDTLASPVPLRAARR